MNTPGAQTVQFTVTTNGKIISFQVVIPSAEWQAIQSGNLGAIQALFQAAMMPFFTASRGK